MTTLTKREKEKIVKQMRKPVDRGATWIGYRPSVMKDLTRDIKLIRRNNKKMCKEYED